MMAFKLFVVGVNVLCYFSIPHISLSLIDLHTKLCKLLWVPL